MLVMKVRRYTLHVLLHTKMNSLLASSFVIEKDFDIIEIVIRSNFGILLLR